MAEVTIQDMMLCRENRARLQTSLLQQYPGKPVLSFCMNIPGPVKTDKEIRSAFEAGKKEILSVLSERNWEIEKEYEIHEKTGDEWIAGIRAEASPLKDAMCEIEEGHSGAYFRYRYYCSGWAKTVPPELSHLSALRTAGTGLCPIPPPQCIGTFCESQRIDTR